MKNKNYSLILILFLFTTVLEAQTTVLLYNGFDNYNGLPPTVAPGWYYSRNDTNAISKSYYNTNGFFGVASPAYKFGFDSVTVISPAFTGADSLVFWMKGNGTVQDSNTFYIYFSTDSIAWSLLASMDSVSPSAAIVSLPLPGTAKHIKFFFQKLVSGYNVGLDDITVLRNGPATVQENSKSLAVDVFPSPTTGLVNVSLATAKKAEITVYNLLGNKVSYVNLEKTNGKNYLLNLAGQQPGLYFIQVKTEQGMTTRRVTLK